MKPRRNGQAQTGKHSKAKQTQAVEQPSIYQPLPEGGYIRILVLQPGDDDEIVCHLETQCFESAKRYAAISYVWGDPGATVAIWCNDTRVQITTNLADALRRFRSRSKTKRVWADALCINQSDSREKGHQVTQMGRVYENATCVLVWLGLDDEGIANGCFDLIRTVNAYFEPHFLQNGRDFHGLPMLEDPSPFPVEEEAWLAVYKLMRLPWFWRVWTVQECSLALRCRMFWGQTSVDIADVVEVSTWCVYHTGLGTLLSSYFGRHDSFILAASLFYNAYGRFRTTQSWHFSRPTLRKLIEIGADSSFVRVLTDLNWLEASDSRDYVYAYLGCVYAKNEHGQPLIGVDYAAPVEKVYEDVAKALLGSPREGPWALSAVMRHSRPRHSPLSYPSWVPRWDRKLALAATNSDGFEAGGQLKNFTAKVTEESHLKLPGFIFDKVIWTTVEIESKNFQILPHTWTPSLRDANEPFLNRLWRNLALVAQDRGFTIRFDDFVLALLQMNAEGSGGLGHLRNDIEIYRIAISSLASKQGRPSRNLMTDEEWDSASWVAQRLAHNADSRCLFLTKSGRIGVARYASIAVGDLCCVIVGAPAPFLIEPGDGGRHRFVSGCCIPGVMSGELLDRYQPRTMVFE